MSTPGLYIKHIEAGYEKIKILNDVSVEIPKNQVSVIIGANASGKSTLLKTMSRLIAPTKGAVCLDERKITSIPPKELAKTIGLLPQSPTVPEGIRVYDLVLRGRFPYQKFLKAADKMDYVAVEEALDLMGIANIADKSVDELSGGQRQRVWIAMALAQDTDILLLDEPTTYLDITYQVEILDLLTELNQKKHTTIVMVLHDINLSARYADYMFAIKKGKLIAQGKPNEIISKELILDVFGLECLVIKDPLSDTPCIIPKGRQKIFH